MTFIQVLNLDPDPLFSLVEWRFGLVTAGVARSNAEEYIRQRQTVAHYSVEHCLHLSSFTRGVEKCLK